MAFPTLKVWIAFSDGPLVVSPTWTDVTNDVRSISTDRGRSDDWGSFEGSAEVVLNNRSRAYDPYYTSGTYYGKLLPRRQIKIEATYSSTTYPVFRGFIAGWPATWTDAGLDSTVTLSCFDALSLISSTQGPVDWATPYITDTFAPKHYYKCNEPIVTLTSGQTIADYGATVQDMTTTANVQPGPQLYPALQASSLGGQTTVTGFPPSITPIAEGGNFSSGNMTKTNTTVMFWFDSPGGGIVKIEFNDWYIYIDGVRNSTTPYGVTVGVYTSTNEYTLNSTNTSMSEEPHHLALTIDTSANIKLYIDGVDVTGTKTTSAGTLPRPYQNITVYNGNVSQIVIANGVATQAQVQNVISWSRLGYKETTYARMGRLLDLASIPSGMRDLNASAAVNVLDVTPDAPYIGPEAQIVANTESAPLFCAKDGKITFYNKSTIFTATKSTTSQQTYGSGGLPMGPSYQIQPDGDSMRNSVNVLMSQGGTYSTSDSTSITTYGTASITWQTEAASLTDAQVSGNMIKTLGSTVYPKTAPIDVVLSPNESWATTLGLELCERITVVAAPPSGNTISLPMLVQRIRHTATPSEWRTTLEGSNRWAQSYTP